MKKVISFLTTTFIVLNINIVVKASNLECIDNDEYTNTMKRDLICLMMAYPEYVKDIERTEDDKVYLVMKSGRKILYDDKKTKSFEEKLANTDLQDMMEQIYPLNMPDKLMEKNFDPGRCRSYPLLQEVYGDSKAKVEANLKIVNVGYHRYQFNKNNNASDSLQAVMKELMPICQSSPKINAALFPASGTFNYRHIADTNRLSPHSFGTAIDLARDKRDYWQWASRTEGEKRLQAYPNELVETFEKHNFVWGGKWSHFDILHFEYRPEIVLKARYFSEKCSSEKKWYEGLPYEESPVKDYIDRINSVIP